MPLQTNSQSSYLFREEQTFQQAWIWWTLGLSAALVSGLMAFIMYRQLVQGEPVGDNPMPNSTLAWFGPLMILIMAGMVLLVRKMKLLTEVHSDHLHIRFFPFLTRNIPLSEIVRWEARTYHPIREYGGWGIRYGFKGKAYNVSGNRGVQLELSGGKKLLIGSQRAEELALAIETAKKRHKNG